MDCLIWSVIYDSRLVNFFIRYSSFCEGSRVPIDPMPGIYQLSVDQLAAEANEIKSLALYEMNLSVILFLIGILGFVLNRKNIILMLISIEVMLLAVTLLVLVSCYSFDDILGQTYSIYIIAIAGADDFQFTANTFSVLSGSNQAFADSAKARFGTA